MRTLAVLSRKGGSGKSCLTRSLAVAALLDGRKVAIIDADEQLTVMAWSNRREAQAPLVIPMGSSTLQKALADVKGRGADLCLIDTPPHARPLITLAAQLSDSAIIVTSTGPEDVEQVAATVQITQQLKKPSAIVLNRTQPRTGSLGLARTALATFGVPLCPTAITQAVGHQYAAAEGLTPQEREPGSKAAQEIGQVYDWLKSKDLI